MIPLEFVGPDGRRGQRAVPAGDVPFAPIGFRFAAPGLLRGVPPTEKFEGEVVARPILDEISKHMAGGQRFKLGTINMLAFARMLAKIGHSYAVAEFGLGAFRPMLPDLILGVSQVAPYLVGGDASGVPVTAQPVLHDVYVQDCLTKGRRYVLAAIQLFAFVGMPRYHVVVGEKGS